MQILRTPESAFAQLKDYPFAPNYLLLQTGLQMHYVEEGNLQSEETILLLHGEPTWSYLYRKMIPLLAQAGYRVIAPDLIGFGKSDKIVEKEHYTYQQHVSWLTELVQKLNLQNITLFCQDWGGLLGLRIVAENPDRFKRVVAANTFLPTGDIAPSEAFLQWQQFSQNTPNFEVGKIVSKGCVKPLDQAGISAYDAPFPEDSYKAAARIFPTLVPTNPQDPATLPNRNAWQVLQQWQKPFLTAFSDSDPITRGGDRFFQKVIPGTKDQKHITVEQAGHFLQEDQPELLAKTIIQFIQDNP
ncbi:MAG: alpha/beta fold hydrolase [Cytophagales bacterium]|nr:MAG: alpha/beta fold hydrolase [Cytophagales bacterium]